MMIRFVLTAFLSLALLAPARAETNELHLGVQRGMTYLVFAVIEHEKLIEKQAAALGIPDLKVTYARFSGGPAMTDALIAGSIDTAATGIPSFLGLWAKGRGRLAVKGLSSYGSVPFGLVTRNPAVKTLADLSDKDRIATPGVKSSTQAILLAMAAEKLYGLTHADHFDSITVTRGHPDAMAALLGGTEINSHFSIPPYMQAELRAPGVHLVTTTEEILGGTMSSGTIFLTVKFAEENPRVMAAYYAALKESAAYITADPHRAAEAYLAVSGEKTALAEIEAIIRIPGTTFDVAPHGVAAVAGFLHRTGVIAAEPKDWKELYLPLVHAEPGS